MTKPKVLCMFDLELPSEAVRILSEVAEVDCLPADCQVLHDIIGNYDAYYGHQGVPIDEPLVARAVKLKAVACATTGTDHLDKQALHRRGIELLTITREYDLLDTFTATAELAWWLLLSCARQTWGAVASVLEGLWSPNHLKFCGGMQLSEATLGVLGYGRLGKMTGEYGKAFRMRVLACDLKPVEAEGVEQVDFDTLLRESDVINIHIHLTPENYHLLSTAEFERMKDGVLLVNTSRGDIIDEDALIAALDSSKVAAAGLDVIHDEWREDMASHPLIQYAREHDNLIITPHIGGGTHKSVAGARVFTAEKLSNFLKTLSFHQ